jgi:hypothetical protein
MELGLARERVAATAAVHGQLDVLELVVPAARPSDDPRWVDFACRTCLSAAWGGHPHVLDWMHSRGCRCSPERICKVAVNRGHMSVIEWGRRRGCRYAEWTHWAMANGWSPTE